jgi:hypothetical protein
LVIIAGMTNLDFPAYFYFSGLLSSYGFNTGLALVSDHTSTASVSGR